MTNTTNKPGDFGQTNANIQKTDAVPSFGIPKTTANDRLAQARQTASGVCEFCDKHGLAILPVRPGIMSTHSGAPELPADLRPGAASGAALPFSGPTRYTGRTVRSGYLYVYDERGSWDWYWITEYGYLMKLPKPGSPMNPAFTVGREPCDRTGHKEIASCITVKDPANARRIWVAFSDTEWTPGVLGLHENEAYRNRHMQVFDVKNWLATHHAPHARPIDAARSFVAEYSAKTRVDAFAFSPYTLRSRASTFGALLKATRSLGPAPGALLMLGDPVGVASEIATRLAELRREFMAKDDRERKFNASTAILGLKEAMAQKAQDDLLGLRDQIDADNHWMSDGTGRPKYNPYADSAPEVEPAVLQQAADDSWINYEKNYDEKARAGWHKDFTSEYKAYNERTLFPLARSHVAWMKSSQMANYFDCTHDGASTDAGLVYVRLLTMCMLDTQSYQPCLDQYCEWLEGTVSEPNNLALRALVLNLKTQRDTLEQQIKPDVAWATIGWDNLCGGFNALAGDALSKKVDVPTNFLLSIGGAITKVLQTTADGPVRQGLVALGMLTQRPVVPVMFTGTFRAFRASVIRQLIKASGIKGMSENALQREVTQALKRMTIQGEPMGSKVSVKVMVMIDEETLKGLPKNLPKAEQVKWVVRSLRTAEDVEALNLSAWRERLNIPASVAKAGAKAAKAFPILGNLISGYVQIATGLSIYDALGSAEGMAKTENVSRLVGAGVLFAATLADSADRMATALGHSKLMAGRAVSLEAFAARAAFSAKVFGIVGAVIGAVWDGYEAVQAYEQGNKNMSSAYALSALAGVGIGFAIFFASIWLAIAAAVLYLFAQYKIATSGGDKLDIWLKRCVWGLGKDKYTDSNIEMSELITATGC